jgi:hypothetical protein
MHYDNDETLMLFIRKKDAISPGTTIGANFFFLQPFGIVSDWTKGSTCHKLGKSNPFKVSSEARIYRRFVTVMFLPRSIHSLNGQIRIKGGGIRAKLFQK